MIETSRLILKVATLDEVQHMLELNSDPEVIRFTGDSHLLNIGEATKVITDRVLPQWNQYKMGRFSVYLKNGSYIGWCGLRYFPDNKEVDLGYRFMKKFWNQGYASEASLACLEYGFKTLKLERIVAKAMPENKDSIKVLQKLKMTFKGYVDDPTDPHPFVLYELLKKDFAL
jgi:ribosomal-protein-alanine N-acetyltransferase